MKRTVTFSYTANVPTTLELKVEVNDETDECEIVRVHRETVQPQITLGTLNEIFRPEELEEIDLAALDFAKAIRGR